MWMKWISAACMTLLMACSGSNNVTVEIRVADSADYTLDRISIVQTDPQPGAGSVRVRLVYQLNQTGGNVAPDVWLFDDDSFFRFKDDVIDIKNFVEGTVGLSTGLHEGFIDFELSCNNDKVEGPEGGTGEGYSDIFGINEAEIKAAAQRPGDGNPVITSEAINLWCEN